MPTPLLEHPTRVGGRSRLLRAVLAGLTATGIAVAVVAPAAAAPVGVPVSPGGQAIGWGYNDLGQSAVPTAPAGQTHTAIAAGYSHSLILTADGHIKSWGYNGFGQVSSTPTGSHSRR